MPYTFYGKDSFIIQILGYNRFENRVLALYIIDKNGRIEDRREKSYPESKDSDKRGCIIITACYGEISPEV